MCPSSETAGRPVRCPICRKPAADAYRPFCSKRCADIDLAKWFGGAYAVPGRDDDEDNGGDPRGGSTGPERDDE